MAKKKDSQAEFIKWFGPVLEALRALGGSAKPKEIAEWIGKAKDIPVLDSSKHGVWALTQQGWNTPLNEKQSHEIFLKWVKVFQDLREKKDTVEGETEKVVKAQEITETEEGQALVNPSLIEVLQSISPVGFEQLCGRLLKEYNFEDIEITQRSHDGGIDGYATLKLNPFVSLSVFFQCKRYQGTVPTEKVQAFIGVMETNDRRVEKGLMITTGSFAKSAIEIEKSNIKLELVDGDKLVEMFEKVELGVFPKTIFEPDIKFFEQYRNMK